MVSVNYLIIIRSNCTRRALLIEFPGRKRYGRKNLEIRPFFPLDVPIPASIAS